MKVVFKVIGSPEQLDELQGKEKNVHFCFRPSEKDIFKLLQKCPGLKRVQLPPSYHSTISKTTKNLLAMKKVGLLVGDVWGHRTDIDQTVEVEL